MTIPFLDLKLQYAAYRDDVQNRLAKVIDNQRFIMGPEVAELEDAIARYVDVEHAIGCASGTDALLLSLKALDLEPGDEVITTAMTFFASAGAVVNAGGTPRFVDVDPLTLNLDPAAAAAAVTPRTRVLMPVHLFGQMAAMESFLDLAKQHDLTVIEDAAQAIGARRRIDGEWCGAGSVGLLGTFSFFPSKNLGAWGDGGMVTTRVERLAERIKLLRVHGGAKRYHHEEVGTNSRLDTLQAAVLLAKLSHLSAWTTRRREHAAAYTEAFEDLGEVAPLHVDSKNEHIYHQYTVRAERRDDLAAHLKENGIGCAVYYPLPLHLQPCFAHLGCKKGMLPITEKATAEVLSLPVFPELTEQQRSRVIECVREFYQ